MTQVPQQSPRNHVPSAHLQMNLDRLLAMRSPMQPAPSRGVLLVEDANHRGIRRSGDLYLKQRQVRLPKQIQQVRKSYSDVSCPQGFTRWLQRYRKCSYLDAGMTRRFHETLSGRTLRDTEASSSFICFTGHAHSNAAAFSRKKARRAISGTPRPCRNGNSRERLTAWKSPLSSLGSSASRAAAFVVWLPNLPGH